MYLAQHIDGMCFQLDGAGGDFFVVGLLITMLNRTFNRDAVLLVDTLQQGGITHDNLHHDIHIAQVDEGYTAMVTNVLYPACNTQGRSNIRFTDLIHGLVAVNIGSVHGLLLSEH